MSQYMSVIPRELDLFRGVFPGLEEVEEFAGVEDVVGVEGVFDGGHGLEFGLGEFEVGERGFGEADAMFSADGAAEFGDFFHDLANGFGGGGTGFQGGAVVHDVDVEVSVAGVPEDSDGQVGVLPDLIHVFDKVGLLAKRDDDVLIELGVGQHEHGGGAFAADLPEVFCVFGILGFEVLDAGLLKPGLDDFGIFQHLCGVAIDFHQDKW